MEYRSSPPWSSIRPSRLVVTVLTLSLQWCSPSIFILRPFVVILAGIFGAPSYGRALPFDGFFVLLSCTEMDALCQSCRKFKPNRGWDLHPDCLVCRSCSQDAPCVICSQWNETQWETVKNFLAGSKRKCPAPATAESSGKGPREGVRTPSAQVSS